MISPNSSIPVSSLSILELISPQLSLPPHLIQQMNTCNFQVYEKRGAVCSLIFVTQLQPKKVLNTCNAIQYFLANKHIRDWHTFAPQPIDDRREKKETSAAVVVVG